MDNVTINVLDSKGNVVMLTVSNDIAERMKNDQMFHSSVMEQVSAVETKALLSGPACAAKLLQPPIPCLTTSTRSLVPLNLSFVKPPSTSQCPNTTTRPSVPPPPSTSQYPITTTRPPVPPPPSTSQYLITTTRPPVILLTSTVKDPPPATLQPGAVCGNPSASIQPSSPPSSQTGMNLKK
ncbi:mucin-7-like isoform X2 [Xyrauchen texanus]|uniref:mucin-7-like isoform X2 n=1 Tax=Xyrauchen texanus TaxID=154827 RepID=UPI00224192E1|nr:mucin-7-like isoform X2 [Xyrauchen texanus]